MIYHYTQFQVPMSKDANIVRNSELHKTATLVLKQCLHFSTDAKFHKNVRLNI
jgi:hypothetical protein